MRRIARLRGDSDIGAEGALRVSRDAPLAQRTSARCRIMDFGRFSTQGKATGHGAAAATGAVRP
jgi:hypothetical protein